MPRRNDLEHRALLVIVNSGNRGVLQSELWRKMSASSREGSRISLKLENKGLIRRERELSGGRWTYRLYPKRKPASINSIIDCPCLMCSDGPRCGAWSSTSPIECERLTQWILELMQKEVNPVGDSWPCQRHGSEKEKENIIIEGLKKRSIVLAPLTSFSKP